MKFWGKYFFMLELMLMANFSFGQGQNINGRGRMQSLFLYNFASKYIEWPEEMKNGNFAIGILGESPVFTELNTLMADKKVFNQSVEILQFNSLHEIKKCHIIFIPAERSNEIEGTSKKLKNSSTLIISENDGALTNGSDLNFVSVYGKLKFEVNKGSIDNKGIRVADDLLKLSINTIYEVPKLIEINKTNLGASGKSLDINPFSTMPANDIPLPEISEKNWEIFSLNINEILSPTNFNEGYIIIYGKDVYKQEYYDTNKIEEGLRKNGKKEGIWKQYYPDGNLKSKITFSENRPNGLYQIFHPNGFLQEEGFWGNNKNLGMYITYYEDGAIQQKYFFNEKGKREGIQKFYYENGNLNVIITMAEGKEHGSAAEYDETGKLLKHKYYINDTEIKFENSMDSLMSLAPLNEIKENDNQLNQRKRDLQNALALNMVQQKILNEKSGLLFQKEAELSEKKEKLIQLIQQSNTTSAYLDSVMIVMEWKKKEVEARELKISQQDKILNKQLEDINKQKFIIYSAIGMFILAMGFVFFVVRANRQRHKAYRIITAQKEQAEKARQLIEEKKEELEQSYSTLSKQQEELQKTFTELKNTQSQLVQSEKMASLGQLTAGVAHEINNPINFVSAGIDSVRQNYIDIKNLLDKYFALPAQGASAEQLKSIEIFKKEIDFAAVMEEMEHLLKSIKNGAMRTTEIVKSLRNFSRLDEYALKKANLHEGIDSTLTILTNKFKNRIEIIKEYGLVPEINCFPGQLNQAFMNILNNAIDAVPDNGSIHIRTKVVHNMAEVRIKDTGKGMTEDVRLKIFEPFFTTKNVGEGTGLGLSITFGIIEKHKGSIQVESALGKGTEFIIQIPMNLG